ncbi:DUF2252 family protein [Nitrobacter hamburgensis]|nr:DUF2252 family protein [Nitrobacter hamburgensis]
MSLNPLAFLRGAAAVMATDLATQPTAGISVQAGGDSHLMNFGAFVPAPPRGAPLQLRWRQHCRCRRRDGQFGCLSKKR